ncbi:MAG: electron transfer flavoprotein subunit alpha/FixB family protein [Candidatus Jordarchaeales archaeon]
MRVFAVAEHRLGEINPVSLELLNFANKIKGDGTSEAVIVGDDVRALSSVLASCADKVWALSGSQLEHYNPESHADVLLQLFEKEPPDLVLLGNTSQGCELAPLLAVRLRCPIVTDVVGASVEGGLIVSRYIYQGKLMVDLKLNRTPCVLTVRQGVFKEGIELRGEVTELRLTPSKPLRRRFSRIIEPEEGEIDVSKAEVIVAVGRGAAPSLKLAEKLASLLNGAVAGSRPVIDSGLLAKDRQVGISGKTVKPKVYLALGISGAFQHVMGMKDSELIIAVNKDPQAPIFNVAHYGVIADVQELLPKLLSKVEERRK